MQKQTLKLFPTPVNYYKDVLSPEQLATIARHCLEVEAGQHGALVGDSKSSFSRSSHFLQDMEARHANLKGLTHGLATILADYGRELGFEGIKLDNSWFNIQHPGSVLKHHVHTDSKVSAGLYIQTDADSSKLYLENPNPLLNFIRPDTYNESNFEFAKFSVAPGDLVLFPSWIKHGSGFEANLSDARIVISMNGI